MATVNFLNFNIFPWGQKQCTKMNLLITIELVKSSLVHICNLGYRYKRFLEWSSVGSSSLVKGWLSDKYRLAKTPSDKKYCLQNTLNPNWPPNKYPYTDKNGCVINTKNVSSKNFKIFWNLPWGQVYKQMFISLH